MDNRRISAPTELCADPEWSGRADTHGSVPARYGAAGLLVFSIVAAWPGAIAAQNIETYFPSGVSGYDQQLGVTVLSRLRPLYEPAGIHAGGFVVRPTLDEGLFYNSDVTGTAGSGSWGTRTSGAVSAASDWDRNRLDGSIGFSNNRFFSFPGDAYTDWNVGLGGGYTINDSLLEAAYSHQSSNQIGAAIGRTTSQTPVLSQTDTAHVDYAFNFGGFSVTPDISVSSYRLGAATVGGIQQEQKFLNRDVLAGGMTGRYSRGDAGGLLVVLRGVTSNYTNPQPGQPSNNSNSLEVLGGIDYQAESVWRYRLLAGVETRVFQAVQYPTHTAPLVEGSVIWTPTGLTTLTGTLSRDIEDPQSAGTNGYVLTNAHLVVDHELLFNVFLQGRAGVEYAQYLQPGGGRQTSINAGAGITWLLSRHVRLSVDYDFNKQTGAGNSSATGFGFSAGDGGFSPFTQSQGLLTVHFVL